MKKALHKPKTEFWLTSYLIFSLVLLNVSSDHIFNKVDNLKLTILLLVCTAGILVFTRIKRGEAGLFLAALIFLLLIPLSTLPGLLLNRENYWIGAELGWSSRIGFAIWTLLCCYIFYQKNDHIKLLSLAWIPVVFVCLIGYLDTLGINPTLRLYLNFFERLELSQLPPYSGLVARAASTFGNVNYFAGFLIQLFPLFLTLFLITIEKHDRNKRSWTIIQFSFLLGLALSIALTGTRAAILACFLSTTMFTAIYIFAFTERRKKTLLTASACIVSAIAVASWVNPELESRFTSLEQSSAWDPRLMGWQAAWESIKTAPIFGYGLNSSYPLFFSYVDQDSRLLVGERSFNHVHNEWLEVLQEGGLVGFSAYIAFWSILIFLLLNVLRQPKYERQEKLLVLASFFGIFAFQFHGLFSVAQRMVSTNVALGLLIAIIFSVYFKKQSTSIKFLEKHSKPALITLLFALTALAWALLSPILVEQKNYTLALAKIKKNQSPMLERAFQQDASVYAMHEGLKILAQKKSAKDLIVLSERLHKTIPHYRNVIYFNALGYVLLGENDRAIESIQQSLNRDTFHLPTLYLATYLAILTDNKSLFRETLEKIIYFHAKKTGVIKSDTGVSASYENILTPITFFYDKEKLRVIISQGFYDNLRSLATTSHKGLPSPITIALTISESMGEDSFFHPKDKKGEPLDRHSKAYRELLQTLSINREIQRLQQKINQRSATGPRNSLLSEIQFFRSIKKTEADTIRPLEDQLKLLLPSVEGQVDRRSFEARRKLLHHIGSWIKKVNELAQRDIR